MARLTFFGPDGSRRTMMPNLYDKPSATLKNVLVTEDDQEEDDDDSERAKEKALQTLVERHPEVLPWEAWAKRTGDDGQKFRRRCCRSAGGQRAFRLTSCCWKRGQERTDSERPASRLSRPSWRATTKSNERY